MEAMRSEWGYYRKIARFGGLDDAVYGDLHASIYYIHDLGKLVDTLYALILTLMVGAFYGCIASEVLQLNEHKTSPNYREFF